MSRVMVEFPTSWQTPYCKSLALRGALPFDDHLSLAEPHCSWSISTPPPSSILLHLPPPSSTPLTYPHRGNGWVPLQHATPFRGIMETPTPLHHAFEWDNGVPSSPQHTIVEGSWRAHSFRSPIPQISTTLQKVFRSQSWGYPFFPLRSCR